MVGESLGGKLGIMPPGAVRQLLVCQVIIRPRLLT
jgi:hypothetical protein